MDFVRPTGCWVGTAKRPASVACEVSGGRDQKRAKDCSHIGQAAAPTVTAIAAPGTKRPFSDHEEFAMQNTTVGGHGAALGDYESHVLQSSDLENSVAIISGALRWRSPVKPYKLPRLHGPRLPTAVRGSVDVGTDNDNDDGNQRGQQLAHQQRRPAGCNGCTPQAHEQQVQQGPEPANQHGRSAQPQPEWGRLFSALSLGGSARGSQRTDPVWAAATSNRTGGGGCGIRGSGWRAANITYGVDSLKVCAQTGSEGCCVGSVGGNQHILPARHSPGDANWSCCPKHQVGNSNAAAAGASASKSMGASVGVKGMDADVVIPDAGLTSALVCAPGAAPRVPGAAAPVPWNLLKLGMACEVMAEAKPVKAAAEQGLGQCTSRTGSVCGARGGFLAQEAYRLLAASGSSHE